MESIISDKPSRFTKCDVTFAFAFISYKRSFTSVSGTIVFTSVLTSYTTIPIGSTVLFNEVLLNEGDGCVDV